jgi:hypothetical protein
VYKSLINVVIALKINTVELSDDTEEDTEEDTEDAIFFIYTFKF